MEEKKCRLFKRCGGCQFDFSYSEQLEYKQQKVRRMLGKFCNVSEIVGMKHPYNYRNKVSHGFYTNTNGRIISGIYQAGSGRIVPCESCNLEDKKATEIILQIKKLMASFKLHPYNFSTQKGFIRHVLVKRSFSTNEILVCIVTSKEGFPSKKNFITALISACPEITTAVQNICTNPMPLTLGTKENVLFGKGYIEDNLCGKKFRVSARSFYQVNPVQTEILYRTAISFAGLDKNSEVLDCYCGTGTIGIIASDVCRSVTGVEVNSQAIADAKANAKANVCNNVNFLCGDAGEFMENMNLQGKKIDAAFLDPPRSGCNKRFLSSLISCSPERIVYISCGIDSLERDLKILTKGGYAVKAIQPVDMFPHTRHIENICLLVRSK